MSYFIYIYILYYILVQLKSKRNRLTDWPIGEMGECLSSLALLLESQAESVEFDLVA